MLDRENSLRQVHIDTVNAFCKIVLTEMKNVFVLGSTNIGPVHTAKTSPPRRSENDTAFPSAIGTDMRPIIEDHTTFWPKLQKSPNSQARRLQNEALTIEPLNKLARERLDMTRQEVSRLIEETKHLPIDEQRVRVRSVLCQLATTRGVGNCEELATFAFLKLIELEFPGKIEFVIFKHVDHAFIVLNRKEGSDINDPKTWGLDAVILDPWINDFFPASELMKKWQKNPWNVLPKDLRMHVKFDDSKFRGEANQPRRSNTA